MGGGSSSKFRARRFDRVTLRARPMLAKTVGGCDLSHCVPWSQINDITITFIELPACTSRDRLVRPGRGRLNVQGNGKPFGAMPHSQGTAGKACVASASEPVIQRGGLTDSVYSMCTFPMIVGSRPSLDDAPKPPSGFWFSCHA